MNRYQQTGKALGSEVVLTILSDEEVLADKTLAGLWQTINEFEKRFSRFLEDSELSMVNQAAGEKTEITPEFSKLLNSVNHFMNKTDGLFTPFVLPDLQRAGYVGSWPSPAQHDPKLSFIKRTAKTPSKIKYDDRSISIPSGAALDFGGIGKGYLLDQLAEELVSAGFKNYWMSIGGDIICEGLDIDGQPWKIGVAEAESNASIITSVKNLKGARIGVATSGTTKRKGDDWHHIIDPRTGKPSTTDIVCATVVMHSAVEADIYAKCLVIAGSQTAKSMIDKLSIHQAVLQMWDNGEMITKQGGALSKISQ